MVRLLFVGLLGLASAGCATTFPRLSLAAQMRIDEETHLDDLPSGRAVMGDDTVRVVSAHALCSGVVVSDGIVLTAQHCVTKGDRDVSPVDAGDVRVELGADALPWGRVGVRHIEACDGYDTVHAPHDISALVLDARLPLDVPQARIRLGANDGESVRAAGYGTGSRVWALPDFESHDRPYGVQAWTSTRAARDGAIIWSTEDMFAAQLSSAHGDSGGPVFSSDGQLVGIASLRVENKTGPGDDVTIFARIDSCWAAIERARTWEASVPRLRS
jgi:S1-C subfamily serine protease